MSEPGEEKVRHVPAVAILHQEGAIAVIALVGLSFGERGLAASLSPRGPLATAVLFGLGIGIVSFAAMWLIRHAAPFKDLETWQRNMVGDWTLGDALAVAAFSGIAEEALMRAMLQPLIGLVPSAVIFAALHIVPDRRLWVWPLIALVLGVVLGLIFEHWGFPAAAAAHVAMNGLSLARFRVLRPS